jgi:hypothetical protein
MAKTPAKIKTAAAAPKTRASNGRPKGRRDIATSQRAMKTKADTLQALELRMSGMSIAAIGIEMKLVPSRIHTLLTACLDNVVVETAEAAKKIDLMRLDALLVKVWPLTSTGQPDAVSSALNIIGRRAKMLGYDQPDPAAGVNVDVNVSASVNVGAAREATVSGLAKLRAAADLKRAAVERIASTVAGGSAA